MRAVFRILLFLVVAGPVSGLWAQTTNARLAGSVTDPNGAVLSGATVTATSTATGLTKSATTGDTGEYVLEALPPGPYKVEVKQSGFANIVQNITLETQQVAALNFSLKVGQATETVNVTEDVPLVEAYSSSISSVVMGKEIADLPLNGRNFTELATLVPGVTRGPATSQASGTGNQAETFRYNNTGGASVAVNGLRPQNNNFLLDGTDNNESLVNTIIFFPPAEAIQEFRVDTSVAPAEFGRAGGGIVNTSIKSGSNAWHGSAFLFERNDELDAREYFQNTGPKTEFRRHQFGGTLGGALKKNKLFVFGDYSGIRQFQPLGVDTATVPTDLMRKGDFSELLSLPKPIIVKDPITGLQANFGGSPNVLNPAEIISAGTNYLNAFPEPNLTAANSLCAQRTTTGVCIQKNFQISRHNVQTFNDFDFRLDYNISDKNVAFGRYSYGTDTETSSSRLPKLPAGFGSGSQWAYPRALVFGETHTFSQSVINEFRFGWIHTSLGYAPPFQSVPLSANLGIVNANTNAVLGGGALIGGNNSQIEYTGDYGPYVVPEQTWNFADSVSLIKGKHSMKFGATILRRQVNLFRPFAGKGFFNLFGDGGGQSPTGYEVSDLLSGFVNNYFVGPALGFSHTRNWETGYYAQDDWRVTRRLTLNLGLRYDLYTWPEETGNLQANFDLATGHLVLPGPGVPGGASLIPTDTNNFAPRVGFAYDLTGRGKTVLRGGFGIFYFLDRGGIDNQLAQNPPFSGQSQFQYNNGFRINLAGIAPNGSNDPTAVSAAGMPGKGPIAVDLNNPQNVSVISYPTTNQNSYAEEWNLQIQQELGKNMAVNLGYVATHGVHLMTPLNFNRQTYDAASGVRPFPNLGNVNVNTTIGGSNYQSLQAEFQRRMMNGLQFQASYTYSHTIDDTPGTLDKGTDVFDFFNFHNYRASSLLDMRHQLIASALYELPFGSGRRYGSGMSGIEQAVIGGWQINPIVALQSGQPFNLNSTFNQLQTFPDFVPGVSVAGNGTINEWFNPSAFTNPPVVNGVFTRPGDVPRDFLVGPNHKHIDLSLFKNFKVGERVTAQFRAQFYNLTNTPQFSQPTFDLGNGNLGSIKSSVLASERQVEMALRFTF
jgi:hypothetical protein